MGCYESTFVDETVAKKKIIIQDDFTKAEISAIKKQAIAENRCIVICQTCDRKYIETRLPEELGRGVYELSHNGIERLS